MKLCRYAHDHIGVLVGNQIADVSAVTEALPTIRWPAPIGDMFIRNLPTLRTQISDLSARSPRRELADLKLEAPVANPTKIICAPVNYRDHIAEAAADQAISVGRPILSIGEAGLFLKATSALIGPGDVIRRRIPDRRTDFEGELVVIIGAEASNVSRSEALDCVAGYSIGLDMTIRGGEDRSLRKSPDTYAVLGPFLVTADEIEDPNELELELKVNGATRQRANTRQLIWDVQHLIEYASSFYTLHPGDLIMTGTPAGVGPVNPGDEISVTIEHLGQLNIRVS